MPASDPARASGDPPAVAARWVWVAALTHALLFGLSYEPIGLWPFALISLAPLIWLALVAASTRLAVTAVLATQIPLWLLLQAWIIDVTVMGYPLLAMYCALYASLFVGDRPTASTYQFFTVAQAQIAGYDVGI